MKIVTKRDEGPSGPRCVLFPITYTDPRRSARPGTAALGLFALSIAAYNPHTLAQNAGTGQVNCNDPMYSGSAGCQSTTANPGYPAAAGMQLSGQTGLNDSAGSQRDAGSPQVYVDQGGVDTRRQNTPGVRSDLFPSDPMTDFQRLVRSSTGEMLSIFGRDLFQRAPSTFAPANQIPVTSDYVVGPGDQILVRLWGAESSNSQLTVDTTGSIYIPRVGAIRVAGLRADQLQDQISNEVNHIFRNYRISVSLGQLRSIQVYVVGEARRPGAYTISALSTVLNALFVSGGPNVQGSLRRIQIRHEGDSPTEFDLYDLVLHGDKTKDIHLQQGDTIFIPAAGPQVALAGSVRHPAIYELRGETTTSDLLQLAGGYTSTARTNLISLERVDHQDLTRKALSISLNDDAGKAMQLRDGDVLFVNHIMPSYEQSVTIRGNLASPGRFAWHQGLRLSDIIPDTKALLTSNYWEERNRLGIPTPLFEPLPNLRGPGCNPTSSPGQANNAGCDNPALPGSAVTPSVQGGQGTSLSETSPSTLFVAGIPGTQGATSAANPVGLASPIPNSDNAAPGVTDQRPEVTSSKSDDRIRNKIQIPAPEIDWSYAVIERLDPHTLKSSLVPFNLGRLVQDHDASQDSELQPGDVVTILSQADIPVSLDERTKFVRLEGEFASAGVYSVRPGEDLESLVHRAGGLTSKAYLYGSSFLRESARAFQQERLNEYISSLSTDMERSAAVRAASSTNGILDPNMLSQQRALVAQLRQLRATGRIVLEFLPATAAINDIPKIPLENGDVFRVPSRPDTVSVVGAVYGQNVFLYNSGRKLGDYVTLAGKPNRIADRKHAFIIRADGSVFSRERTQGVLSNNFESSPIYAGDAIVIPEKLIKPTALRNVLDYSQVLSSFGLAAAAINVVR